MTKTNKNVHTVTINGRVEKRTSENRVYTHALLARVDFTTALEKASKPFTARELADMKTGSYDWYAKIAGATWGEPTEAWAKGQYLLATSGETWDHSGAPLHMMPKDIEAAKKETADGWDGYVARQHAERVQAVHNAAARGHYLWKVISWHGTQKNAEAAATTARNRNWFAEVKVVAVGADVVLNGDHQGV